MLVGLTTIAERRVEEEGKGKGKGKGKGGGSVVALGEYISFRVSNVHFQFRHSKIQSNGSFKLPVPSPRAIIMTAHLVFICVLHSAFYVYLLKVICIWVALAKRSSC